MKFGIADTRSIRMLESFRYGFFFSDLIENSSERLRKFILKECLSKGAALFGRETKQSLNDFRQAANGALDNASDDEVAAIIQFAVQRLRNYGHIKSLQEARFKLARIVLTKDTEAICRWMAGKLFDVKVAAATIDRLTLLVPDEYARLLYHSENGRAFDADPIRHVSNRIANNLLNDDLIAEGRCIPPFYLRCSCLVEGCFDF